VKVAARPDQGRTPRPTTALKLLDGALNSGGHSVRSYRSRLVKYGNADRSWCRRIGSGWKTGGQDEVNVQCRHQTDTDVQKKVVTEFCEQRPVPFTRTIALSIWEDIDGNFSLASLHLTSKYNIGWNRLRMGFCSGKNSEIYAGN
jgi:hypothetical protein